MKIATTTQIRAIAALLNNQDINIAPHLITGRWRIYYKWIATTLAGETDTVIRWYEFGQQLMTYHGEEGHTDYEWIQTVNDTPAPLPTVDSVLANIPDLTWLWPGWIARGLLTLLVGDPGTGKSYLTLDLAQRVVAGAAWPDDSPVPTSGSVLYVDAENTPQIFKQRIVTWSSDERKQLYYMIPTNDRMMINFDDIADRDHFLDIVFRCRPQLIIIDSYGSVTLRAENAKEDVQRLLAFLTRTAKDFNCGMLLTHHNRKKSSSQLSLPGMPMLLSDVRGSGHIGAMARNVIGMQLVQASKTMDRNGPRKIEVIKSNIGKYPEAVGVEFKQWPENPEVAVLSYGDPAREYRNKKVERCMEWLIDLLTDLGPLSPAEILEIAADEEYNERMIYRARERLSDEITDTIGHKATGNEWELTGETEPTPKPSKLIQCKDWLLNILKNGPVSPQNIIDASHEFSESTIYRARRELAEQIKDTKGPKVTGNQWERSVTLSALTH